MNMYSLAVVLALGQLSLALPGSEEIEANFRGTCLQIDHNMRRSAPRGMMHAMIEADDLPEHFSWQNVNGTSYITSPVNQHIPQYCGGCWAFAATSAMSDRLNIVRNNAWPRTVVQPQNLINCDGGGTCNGGDSFRAYNFVKENGIVDNTCLQFEAYNGDCSDIGHCMDCKPGKTGDTFLPGTCYPVPEYKKYYVESAERLDPADGPHAMKAEIYARGPINCAMAATPDFDNVYKSGIYEEDRVITSEDLNHEIEVIGWGKEVVNGTEIEYWEVRNSWGLWWGENGNFRINMHKGSLGIGMECVYPLMSPEPKVFKIADHKKEQKQDGDDKESAEQTVWNKAYDFVSAVINHGQEELHHAVKDIADQLKAGESEHPQGKFSGMFHGYVAPETPVEPVVLSAMPHSYVTPETLPKFYDIRNMNGTSYATTDLNQHIPHYCGSCWAHACASSMSDRLKMMRNADGPDFVVSPQYLVNCAIEDSNKGCNGGDQVTTFKHVHDHGATDTTCLAYLARDDVCEPETICQNCEPKKGCYAVKNPLKLFVKEYGPLPNNATAIMAEVYARGPVACGVAVNDLFDNYKGGIMYDKTGFKEIDHVVEIAGWGEETQDDGTVLPYWIIRNSWGTWWGEDGWFRVVRGIDNLAIESQCAFAVPDIERFMKDQAAAIGNH
eukprot:Clim_evm52s199 gene=Clim_evmTU52s199